MSSTAVLIVVEATPRGPHPFREIYVERWWTPVLGPSAMMLGRHIALELDCTVDDEILLDCDRAGAHLGLAAPRFLAAFERLVRFNILVGHDGPGLAFPLFMPDVPPRHRERWPVAMQMDYEQHVTVST